MTEYIVTCDEETASWIGNDVDSMRRIVRCRDCKHFTPEGTYKFGNGKVNADFCTYVRGWMLQLTPDGFCAWAERKEGSNG